MGDTKQDQKKKIAIDIYGEEIAEREDLDDIINDMLAVLPRVEEEYLVSGARLTCSEACKTIKRINGIEFFTTRGGESVLRVEGSVTADNAPIANVNDNKKDKNIFHFGNCNAELTFKEKMELRSNSKARAEGICSYLMKIDDLWENEPVTSGKEYFTYREAEGINRMSKLFCYKKGWITPLTSGQENRKISVQHGAVTKEDLQFALENNLSGKKLYVLADIREHFDQYPELLEKTTIFAYEGLADEQTEETFWNGYNIYHPKGQGQFGAIMLVAKKGKLTYYQGYASTLPDNMKKAATICDGNYEVKSGAHGVTDTFEGYAALVLNNNKDIPAYNSIDQDDTADHIHLHMAGILKSDDPDSPYSRGCITIPMKDYVAFGKVVGFISKDTDDSIGTHEKDQYKYEKFKLEFSKHTKAFEGYIVIDRKYYDDTEGYLEFNAPKEGK